MNESQQRKSGAILSYVSLILSTVVQLLYTPFLIRMLGQSEYGLYSLIASIIGCLTILDLGFGNAIVVYTVKYRTQKQYEEEERLHGMFKIIFTIIGIIAAMIGVVIYLLVPSIFSNTMTSIEIEKAKIMMLILAFNLFITFSFNIYTSIINAYEKFTFQKIMSILNTLLKPILMIPLLFLGYKSITMTIVITIVNIIVCISNYSYCRNTLNKKIKFKGIDKSILKIILGYSVWILLTSIVDKINWSLDQFILGVVSGTTAVSVYSVATNINTLFINLSTAISGVMLPKMTKMVASHNSREQITDEFIKIGRIQYYIMFLITTGFILFGREFIIWWAGKEYVESYYVTLCLITPAFFSLIQNVGLSIMQAMNKFKFKALSTFVMAIFNACISFFFAKLYGPVGAALGTTISIVLCNIIIMNIYYYKVIKIDVIRFWKEIIKNTVKYIVPIILIIFIMKITQVSGIISVVLYGGIYTLMYVFVSYKFVMNQYEKNIVNSIIKKIIRK